MHTTNSCWKRLLFDDTPIYVAPELPDWFVADPAADALLTESAVVDDGTSSLLLARSRLLSLLSRAPARPYLGRHEALTLTALKECWFHLTHACNLACRHCLFAASPAASQAIDPQLLRGAIRQARELGCAIFYFTGGEPFVYPDFSSLLLELFKEAGCHAVVLTNGLLLGEQQEFLRAAPRDRLHLQISLDGLEKNHDALRGHGSFARLMKALALLRELSLRPTLSIAVNRTNVADLCALVDLACEQGVSNMHLLWHFVRGKGSREQFVAPSEIWHFLRPALERAEERGVSIDNLELLRSQVFSSPGTRHDLSNSGWESLAVGPDAMIYPSPALVGVTELCCGAVTDGLREVWHHSPVLKRVRQATLAGSPYEHNPLRFLIGGGDSDHSFMSGGVFSGHDPYVELYNHMALWLIARQAHRYPQNNRGEIVLKMGDVRFDCPDGGNEVSITHCNCVLSLGDDAGHATVREFYGRAAAEANDDIVNPFAGGQAEATFIPEVSRRRSYGCGSPVLDAELAAGEVLVDLGSGSGVECFQAAELVGADGRVFGIDMTEAMLMLARSSQRTVAARLGYDNVEFRHGFLEAIPLEDGSADAVISNCVINLSPDKRRTLLEAFRVLKPGGRLVVSDIVTDEPIPVRIKNNDQLRGECLGGAMRQEELMAMLHFAGFNAITLVKRFPYRTVENTRFFSLTFRAWKPRQESDRDIIYRGPFAAVLTESGAMLLKGAKCTVGGSDIAIRDESVFVVDGDGAVTNIEQSGGCCALPPEVLRGKEEKKKEQREHSDCMVCGSELHYITAEQEKSCHYCGVRKNANAFCLNGHFVCDACHQDKGLAVIKKICTESAVEDMITLLKKVRARPEISMHGPEHHALVPGIILSTYRARGGKVGKKEIRVAIERGSRVPGGVCGFWGSCGAALGVGIAFSVIVEATPITPAQRQKAQQATAAILGIIASFKAGRCCQRECVVALREAAKLSAAILPVPLLAADSLHCEQYPLNRECVRKACPLWETRDQAAGHGQPIALVI